MDKAQEEKLVREWRNKITAGEEIRKKELARWMRYVDYYANRFWFTDTNVPLDLGNYASLNLVYPMLKILVNTSYARNAHIFVRPRSNDSAITAAYFEFRLNWLWDEINVHKHIKRCIVDGVLQSIGCMDNGIPGSFQPTGEDVTVGKLPYARRVSPRHLIPDPDATCWDEGESYMRALEKSIPWAQFKKLWPAAAKEIRANNKVQMPKWAGAEASDSDEPPASARVSYYQVQDLLSNAFYLIAKEGFDQFLEVIPNPYSMEGFTAETLIFNEIPDELMPMSDVCPIEDIQREMNRIRTYEYRHWKLIHPRVVVPPDTMTAEEKELLTNAEDLSIVEVTGGIRTLDVLDLSKSGIKEDIGIHEQKLKSDYRETVGIDDYMRAGRVEGTKTAYETRQITQGTGVRLAGHGNEVGDFAQRIARKHIQIIKDLGKVPVSYPTLQGNQVKWVQLSKEQIKREVDVRVYLGTTMPPDEQNDKLQAKDFYQTFRPDPAADQFKVLRRALQMWGIPNPDDFIINQGDIGPFMGGPGGPAGSQTSNTNKGMAKALMGTTGLVGGAK